MGLIDRLRMGDARAAARAMSLVEDQAPEAATLVRGLAPFIGRAHIVGVTGPPGVGKSTLIAALAAVVRAGGRSVGIVAADPSSAFTGGAILGDRIRMRRLFEDAQVFIRSMATRGASGSLPPAAHDVCRVMDAMGKDLIFLETVGTGQSDLAVARYADTVVLVLSPASGDAVQAMKAGLMEVADIITVNKADLPGADQTVTDLTAFLASRTAEDSRWAVPVVATTGTAGCLQPACEEEHRLRTTGGTGMAALLEEIDRHQEHVRRTGELEQRRRDRLRREIADHCVAQVVARVLAARGLDVGVADVISGRLTAAEAGRRLADELMGTAGGQGADPRPHEA